MSETKIFILSGPKQSGKTSRLIDWAKNIKYLYGIFTPMINGYRFFMNAATKEIFKMETLPEEPDSLPVGKYVFSGSAFHVANRILQGALLQKNSWLIIDEIGPLELSGKGFHDMLKESLYKQNENRKIVLVVREELLEEVVRFFGIEKYEPFDFVLVEP